MATLQFDSRIQRDVAFLQAHPGPALCESLLRCAFAGKPYGYDPFNAKARNNLGVLYLDDGRFAEGLEQLTVALKEEPDYLEAAYNRAVALQRLGRVEEAADVLSALGPRLRSASTSDASRRAADALLGDGVIGAARDEGGEP